MRRVYEELRAIVEELGGTMRYQREGKPHGGSWVVVLPGFAEKRFDSQPGFPALERLYVPRIPNPTDWRDYTNTLRPDGSEKWIAMLKAP
jgi:hypothetical protein